MISTTRSRRSVPCPPVLPVHPAQSHLPACLACYCLLPASTMPSVTPTSVSRGRVSGRVPEVFQLGNSVRVCSRWSGWCLTFCLHWSLLQGVERTEARKETAANERKEKRHTADTSRRITADVGLLETKRSVVFGA